MFPILGFSLLAVLLVVAGVAAVSRNRSQLHADEHEHATTHANRRGRKQRRAQSRHDRRKRH
jgi:hypothetical protein